MLIFKSFFDCAECWIHLPELYKIFILYNSGPFFGSLLILLPSLSLFSLIFRRIIFYLIPDLRIFSNSIYNCHADNNYWYRWPKCCRFIHLKTPFFNYHFSNCPSNPKWLQKATVPVMRYILSWPVLICRFFKCGSYVANAFNLNLRKQFFIKLFKIMSW